MTRTRHGRKLSSQEKSGLSFAPTLSTVASRAHRSILRSDGEALVMETPTLHLVLLLLLPMLPILTRAADVEVYSIDQVTPAPHMQPYLKAFGTSKLAG